MAEPVGVTPERLAEALKDYWRTPGNYAVRLGQPPELHQAWDTVVQWALGRVPEALQADAGVLAAAAMMFLKRTCFAPDSTLYETLALSPEMCTPERVRARYRVLIRLAHPDVGMTGLPADAARRVNLAYETLSDADKRRAYDDKCREQQGAGAARTVPPVRPAPHGPRKTPPLRTNRWDMIRARHPQLMRQAATVTGVLLLAGGVIGWMVRDTRDSRMLIATRLPATAEPAAVVTSSRDAHVNPPPAQTPRAPRAADKDKGDAEGRASTTLAAPATPSPAWVPTPTPPAPAAVAAAALPVSVSMPTTPPMPTPAPPPSPVPLAVATADPTPAAPPPAQPASTPTAAPPPVPAQATAPVPAPSLPPSPPPPAPATWPVDAAGAQQFLADVVATLSTARTASRTHAYLAESKVKGSLLQPAMAHLDGATRWQVRRTAWNSTTQGGVLRLRGTVSLEPQGGTAAPMALDVVADFRGTRDGTVLEQLDMKAAE